MEKLEYYEIRKYNSEWIEVVEPKVNGFEWYVLKSHDSYYVEYTDLNEEEHSFCHEPSDREEQKLVEDATVEDIILWAHKDIMERDVEEYEVLHDEF